MSEVDLLTVGDSADTLRWAGEASLVERPLALQQFVLASWREVKSGHGAPTGRHVPPPAPHLISATTGWSCPRSAWPARPINEHDGGCDIRARRPTTRLVHIPMMEPREDVRDRRALRPRVVVGLQDDPPEGRMGRRTSPPLRARVLRADQCCVAFARDDRLIW